MIPLAALLLGALVATILLPGAAPGQEAQCDSERVDVGVVQATGCLRKGTDARGEDYLEAGAVSINGLLAESQDANRPIRFYQGGDGSPGSSPRRVTSQGAPVAFRGAPNAGVIALSRWTNQALDVNPPASGDFELFDRPLAAPFSLFPNIAPLPVNVPVTLSSGGVARLDYKLMLSDLIPLLDQQGATFGLSWQVNPDGSSRFAGLVSRLATGLTVVKLLQLQELGVKLDLDPFLLDADATVKIPALGGLGLIGGFSVDERGPSRIKGGATGLNIPLPNEFVFNLQKVVVEAIIRPFVGLETTLGMSAGRQISLFGRDVSMLAAEGGAQVRGPVGEPPNQRPASIRVFGEGSVGGIPVARADAAWHIGYGTTFATDYGLGLPSLGPNRGDPFFAGGGFHGWTTSNRFNFESGAYILKVIGQQFSGINGVLSDVGTGGCATLGSIKGGGGVLFRTNPPRPEIFTPFSCDLGRFRSSMSAPARSNLATASRARFRVPADVAMIRLRGAEDVPNVMLEQAVQGGTRLQTPAESDPPPPLDGPDGVAIAERDPGGKLAAAAAAGEIAGDTEADEAFFFLPEDRPAGGPWTVRSLDPSEPLAIESISFASELPDPNVSVELKGGGTSRELSWNARDIPHQSLVFTEVLPDGSENGLFRTGRDDGSRRVELARGLGSYGKRKIEVDVRQRAETPREEFVAETYRVRPPAVPGRVRAVRANLDDNDLEVRWRRVGGADGYRVAATGAGPGLRQVANLPGGQEHVTLEGIPTGERMKVSVTAENRDDVRGRPGRTTLKTANLVRGPRAALKRMLRGAKHVKRERGVLTRPMCPAGGGCTFRLLTKRGGELLGRDVLRLSPDNTGELTALAPGRRRLSVEAELVYRGETFSRRAPLRR